MARRIGWAAVSLVVFACGGAVEEKDDSTGAGGTTGGRGGAASGHGGTTGGGGSGAGAAGSGAGGGIGGTLSVEVRPHPACYQPPDTGSCQGSSQRYYFDAGTGRCQVFTYSGCGGNDNNFELFERCERICLRTDLSCDCHGASSSGCSFDPECWGCPINFYVAGNTPCTTTGLHCGYSGGNSCRCVTVGNAQVWQCGTSV